MEDTSTKIIENLLNELRSFYGTDQTKSLSFRVKMLKRFKANIIRYEEKITGALWKDLHKSFEESYLTEISIVLQEIDYHLKHLKQWTKPRSVNTPFHLLPSSAKIIYEPLGVTLIIAPWNYPFQLLMNPLVGSISSGCCTMLKPSPYASNIAMVMEELIHETFESGYISIVQGDRNINEILLKQRFDMIFFTGSPIVGKAVMKAAAENLTPVVLELGGKSPCIVDFDADISKAAKRIAWGKTINAGQTCIAPDYLFVHQSVKQELLRKIIDNFHKMYGPDVQLSKYYPRIVSQRAFTRLQKLMEHGRIVYGGTMDADDKYISPTIIDDVNPEFPIMQEEIFGPILPVLTFHKIDEVISYINEKEKPLAFYYFGKKKKAKEILSKTTSGGACINDTLIHIANHHLPFGGVGNSGFGKYHGKNSFLAFSNPRSVVYSPVWIDLPMRYAPYWKFKFVKKIL
ncbi:MAG: aldehyde dehydrogenase [Bacteroidales bacterium]|jgi:aldehyde dehydrogenase (NAD+)